MAILGIKSLTMCDTQTMVYINQTNCEKKSGKNMFNHFTEIFNYSDSDPILVKILHKNCDIDSLPSL